VADLKYEDDEFSMDNLADQTIVANPVAPVAFARSGQRLTDETRIRQLFEPFL
jgi:hypothetical protein